MAIRQQLDLVRTLSAAAGDTVGDNTPTTVGGVQHNPGGDQLILSVQYTKDDETGIYIYVVFLESATSTVEYTDGWYLDIATGVNKYNAMKFQFDASANTDLPIDLRNRPFFKVYQTSTAVITGTPGKVIVKARILG